MTFFVASTPKFQKIFFALLSLPLSLSLSHTHTQHTHKTEKYCDNIIPYILKETLLLKTESRNNVFSCMATFNILTTNFLVVFLLVNCKWLEWNQWTVCSKTCGGGTTTRSRGKVPAQNGGKECEGKSSETKACNTKPCDGDYIALIHNYYNVIFL